MLYEAYTETLYMWNTEWIAWDQVGSVSSAAGSMQCNSFTNVQSPTEYWGAQPPGLYKLQVVINQARGGGQIANFSQQFTIPEPPI